MRRLLLNSRSLLSEEKGLKGHSTNRSRTKMGQIDGCSDTWTEVMKLPIEEENFSKKQECIALTSNLEATVLICVMTKRTNERDSAQKMLEILLTRFGPGCAGHQAMVKFEKRRQRDDESIGKFLDNIELLKRGSSPDEIISGRNLAKPRSSWTE